MSTDTSVTREQALVLVVEDDAEVRESLCAALELEGYAVHIATDGTQARDAARTLKPDVILMDILMPVMSGIEATKVLKADEATRHIPVLIITVMDKKEDIIHGLEAGATDYITKPFFMPELKARLTAILRSKRLYDECTELQQRLATSEEKYRLLVESASEAILVVQDGMLRFFNPKALEFMGRTHEELTSTPFVELIHPDDRQKTLDYCEKERLHGKALSGLAFRIVTADGHIRWLETNAVLIDWEGKPGTMSFVSDITERKKAEETLRESEERYRTVLEANPDPVVVYDMDGKVLYFNPAFTRVFGWTMEDCSGKRMDMFVPEESWPTTRKMIDRVLHGESFSGVETCRCTKWGKKIPVSISAAIYRDENGGPRGSVVNLRDISDQKNLESQLQQAQKMEAVGTLAGGVAHDFNNLLQAMQGYTELLLARRDKEKPGWRELHEILRAAKRGSELTRQLLTFSRKVESERRPLDLNREVEEVGELLKRTIPRMIEVELRLTGDITIVNADPVQVKQIIMNLAVNAKDAMPEGGRLSIATENVVMGGEYRRKHPEVKLGNYVLLTISDSGHGMDKETLEHIFEPFYTTKDVGKGTGLGLAMVYGIVKNHEGYIMCHSEPGNGSIFGIYLPATEQEVERGETDETQVPVLRGNETILLVDDEDFVRELGVELLGGSGYTILTAADGESALELYRLRQEPIHLVIVDLIMPGMGGKKFLEELLKIDAQAKVLLASGYGPDGSTQEAFRVGAKGFVGKPYNIRQMLKLIRTILDEDTCQLAI